MSRREVDIDADAFAERAVEQVRHAADELVAVDALWQQRLGAREGEQAAGQRGGAGCAFHRIVQVHHHLAARAVEPAQRKVDAADDDGEHVVEVVRDAAGELADGFHLLDLAKLGFGGFAFLRPLLQRLVGFPQLLRALADGLLELLGALGLGFDLRRAAAFWRSA